MTKLKDGFYKQLNSTIGSNDYLLKAAGGYIGVGHASGNVPISDGTLNTSLNADQLDGMDASAFVYELDTNGDYIRWKKYNGSWNNIIAPTANKWYTARTLTLTGSVIGSVSINGSQDVTLNTTTNHTHNTLDTVTTSNNTNYYLTFVDSNNSTVTQESFYTSDKIFFNPSTGKLTAYNLLLKNSNNYGTKLNFGDGDYVYLYEDTDDYLTIYAKNGVKLTSNSNNKTLMDGYTVLNANNWIDYVTTYLYATTVSGTSNTSTSDPYLRLFNSTTARSSIQLKAGSNMSISSSSGIITFTASTSASTTVENKAATIGTSLTTIATINSTNITAKVDHSRTAISSGTAGTWLATSGSTVEIPYITVNSDGHVEAKGTHIHTITGFLSSISVSNSAPALGKTASTIGTIEGVSLTASVSDSDKVDGYHVSVVSTLPGSPSSDTFYVII